MSEENEKRETEKDSEEQKAQVAKIERQIQQLLFKLLSSPAKSRLNNVRLVNSNLYLQAVQTLAILDQQGKIKEPLSDEQLKALLIKIKPKAHSSVIKRI